MSKLALSRLWMPLALTVAVVVISVGCVYGSTQTEKPARVVLALFAVWASGTLAMTWWLLPKWAPGSGRQGILLVGIAMAGLLMALLIALTPMALAVHNHFYGHSHLPAAGATAVWCLLAGFFLTGLVRAGWLLDGRAAGWLPFRDDAPSPDATAPDTPSQALAQAPAPATTEPEAQGVSL